LLTASLETRRHTSLRLCASCGDTLRARHRHDGFEFALGSQPMFDVVAVREPFLREELIGTQRDLRMRHVGFWMFL
jgi:hypothetical protein